MIQRSTSRREGLALLPVSIVRTVPAAAGEVYSVTLRATYLRPLASDIPKPDPFNGLLDIHMEYKPLSAATLGVIVADPTKLNIKPQRDPNGGVCVTGSIAPMPANPTGGQGTQLQVDILGAKHELMGTKPVFPDRFGQLPGLLEEHRDSQPGAGPLRCDHLPGSG